MAESVGSLHIEGTANVAGIKKGMTEAGASVAKFSATTKADMGKAARAVRSGASGMASMRTATASTTTAMGKFTEQTRGAPGAIAAATASMRAFGATGNAAVTAVGTGMASLAASGFTGVSLAIALATTAIALFASKTSTAAAEAKELETALTKLTERNLELARSLDKRALAARALGGGVGTDIQGLTEDRDRILARLSGKPFLAPDAGEEGALARRKAMLDFTYVVVEDTVDATDRFRKNIKATGEEAETLRIQLRLILREIAALEAEAAKQTRERIAAANARLRKPIDRPLPFDLGGGTGAGESRSGQTPIGEAHRRAGFDETLKDLDESTKAWKEWRDEHADVVRDIHKAQSQLAFDISQVTRSSTEQQVEEIRRRHAALIEEAKKYGESTVELERLRDQQIAQVRQAGLDKQTKADFDARGEALDQQMDAMRSQMEEVQRSAEQTRDVIASNMTDAIMDFAAGTITAADAFKQMAASIISDLIRIAIQKQLTNVIGTALGLTATTASGIRLDAERAVGESPMGGDVIVNIDNRASGVKASSTERMGPRGPELNVVIEDVVIGSIESGGRISRTLSRHGLQRRGRRGG